MPVMLGDIVIFTTFERKEVPGFVVKADESSGRVNIVYWTEQGSDQCVRNIEEGDGPGCFRRKENR